MIRSVVLLCTVGVVLGFGGMEQKLKKYTHMKTIIGCVGEEPVLAFFRELRAACEACKARDMSVPNDIDLTTFIKDIHDKTYGGRNPMLVPVYYIPQQQQPQYYNPYNQYQQYQQYPQQYQYSGHNLGKRSIRPNNYDSMADMLNAKISNITCIMRAMRFIDENDQPNYDEFTNWIQRLNIPEDLRNDFYEGQEFCREFSSCLPVHKIKNPLAQKFGKCFAFMKCYKMKELKACMKQDFRKYAPMLLGGSTAGGQNSYDYLMNSSGDSTDMMMQNMFSLMQGDALDF